ncbi:MAG: hypothetical protein ABIQ31_25725, partial [Ferruginibacter sp.]
MPKKSGRHLLRNLVIVLTGAVVLSLTSCSKDPLPPGGDVGATPPAWYNLRAIYHYNEKTTDTVYLTGVDD